MAIELPAIIELDGSDSFDDDGRIRDYQWELSDGRRRTGKTAQVPFENGDAGSYTATLTVTDNDGATASDTVSFELEEPQGLPPLPAFNISQGSGTVPFTVDFDATPSSDDDEIIGYIWDFFPSGDQKRGVKTSKRFTEEDVGQVTVRLTVVDIDKQRNSADATINVNRPRNEPPNAVIQADKNSGRAPLTVTFDASESTPGDDPYGTELSFDWFVNQNPVSNSGPTFTDTFDAGAQQVEVEVTDPEGATDSASTTVDVEAPPNDPPNAVADATPSSAEVPATVEFTGRNSSDPNNNIESYAWEFSDGTTQTGKTVTRDFGEDAPQQVTGTLTVTDIRGETSTDAATVTLTQPGGIIDGIDNETVAQATIIGAGVASSLIFD